MADESVFRSIVIINIALALPIGLYHRIGSQATGEGLARSGVGVFIMIGVRPCGLLGWVALAAYLINPAWIALGFDPPAHMAAVDAVRFSGSLRHHRPCSGRSEALGRTSRIPSSPGGTIRWSPMARIAGFGTRSMIWFSSGGFPRVCSPPIGSWRSWGSRRLR